MKPDRKEKILELIGKYNISNQEELRNYLLMEGYDVTQSTVSKDMKALMLAKITGSDGKQYYKAVSSMVDMQKKFRNILRDGFLSMQTSGNMLVIKTVSGMAMAVASAIDNLNIGGIAGSIAGDDTIFAAIITGENPVVVEENIAKLIED
ncbi:MAG: arginine repressor [Eubacteriales bacterium]|nr:arginine repressor [Eubacteriales bacterium]